MSEAAPKPFCRELKIWENVWKIGAVTLFVTVAAVLTLLESLIESQPYIEPQYLIFILLLPGLTALFAGTLGQYIGWMARLPGGASAWRVLLLLLPGVNLIWFFCELLRDFIHLTRNEKLSWRAGGFAAILVATLCLAVTALAAAGAALWLFAGTETILTHLFMVAPWAFLAWMVAFGLISELLNRAAALLPAGPDSGLHWRWVPALLLGVVYGTLLALVMARLLA